MSIKVEEVSIDNCRVDPEFNTRTHGLGDLTGLIESIKSGGIEQPLSGKVSDSGMVDIFVGFRRFAAAQEAGLSKIPIKLYPRRKVTLKQMLLKNVIENVHRENLNPVDEALAFQRMQTDHKMSTDEICGELGLKKSYIQNRFRLLKLEEIVRDAVHRGRISITSALDIDRLPKDKQKRFVDIAEDMGGQKLTDLIDKELNKIQKKIDTKDGPEDTSPESPVDPNDVAECVRSSKRYVSHLTDALKYSSEESEGIKGVNLRVLELDDLKAVTKFYGDLCDIVEPEIEFNEKAQKEIISTVEGQLNVELDLEAPVVRQSLIRSVSERAQEIARVQAGEGKRPRVTYQIAKEAIDEFYDPIESE